MVAVGLAAGCVPSTLARLQGGTGSEYLALLAALVPLTLPVLLVALALALVAVRAHRWRTWTTRRRTRALVVALPLVLLAVHGGWTLPSLLSGSSVFAPPGPAAGSTGVRVLALNLEFGQADAAQVVDVVRREQVDVLAAVELTPDAVDRLRAAGLETLLPQSQLLAEPGADGSGLWSRFPLTGLDPVPGTRFRTPQARLALPTGPVVVTVAHPSPPTSPDLAVADLRTLGGAVADGSPRIVAGDFNATRDIAPFRALLGAGLADAADQVGLFGGAWPGLTWPADLPIPPVMRLDHVLVSPRHFEVGTVRTVSVDGTDHRGVLAELATR